MAFRQHKQLCLPLEEKTFRQQFRYNDGVRHINPDVVNSPNMETPTRNDIYWRSYVPRNNWFKHFRIYATSACKCLINYSKSSTSSVRAEIKPSVTTRGRKLFGAAHWNSIPNRVLFIMHAQHFHLKIHRFIVQVTLEARLINERKTFFFADFHHLTATSIKI